MLRNVFVMILVSLIASGMLFQTANASQTDDRSTYYHCHERGADHFYCHTGTLPCNG